MKKLYIIDGYNMIHRIDRFRAQMVQSLEKGRSALVTKLSSFQAQRRVAVTIVFDGDSALGIYPESRGSVEILYSKPPKKADDLIKRLVDEQHNKNDITVVSSDMAVMHYAKASGCGTMSSEKFFSYMSESGPESVAEDLGKKGDPQLSRSEIRDWIDLFNRSESDDEKG